MQAEVTGLVGTPCAGGSPSFLVGGLARVAAAVVVVVVVVLASGVQMLSHLFALGH